MLLNRVNKKSVVGTLLALSIALPLTNTIAAGPGQSADRPGGPPQEAIAACSDSTEGAACSFSGSRGDVEGTCKAPPQGDGALACAPAGGRPGKGGPR